MVVVRGPEQPLPKFGHSRHSSNGPVEKSFSQILFMPTSQFCPIKNQFLKRRQRTYTLTMPTEIVFNQDLFFYKNMVGYNQLKGTAYRVGGELRVGAQAAPRRPL
jgi:hypothetical protein